MTGVPSSIDEITPQWLTGVLSASTELGDARVSAVDATVLGESHGLVSQVAQLRISYDGDAPGAPQQLIAKRPPLDNAVRDTAEQMGFFEHESRFYSELAERAGIRAPRCYFTYYDPADGAFLTLLEDLSGARPGDAGVGCSIDDAFSALRTLAGLHASWWDSPKLDGLGWLKTQRARLDEGLPFLDDARPPFEERFAAGLGPESLSRLLATCATVARAREVVTRGPQTLLHGDYSADNLFFDSDGEVIVFDWGLVTKGPPVFDVAYFLTISLDTEVRRRHEEALLRAYLDGLAARGIHYGVEECMTAYGEQLAGFVPRLVGAGGLAEFADEAHKTRYLVWLHRALAAMADHPPSALLA